MPAGVQLGLGVKTAAVYRIHDQGDFVNTENSFDLAIQGSGYFVGRASRRRVRLHPLGQLPAQPEGQLVTPDGYTVSPAITVPQDAVEVSINQEGLVSAKIAGQVAEQELGQLQLATFVNEAGLEATGSNLLQETAASGPAMAGPPGTEGWARCCRAFSRAPTSTRCRRSPR